MAIANTHKFVIDTASARIGQLADQLKDLDGSDTTKAKDINQQIIDVFSFLESYVEDMKAYKAKIEEDIHSANLLMEKKLYVLSNDTQYVENRIETTPEFCNNNEVENIYESLNKISLGVFQAGEKAKDIKGSIDIHIKDIESFIENKTDAMNKMIQESKAQEEPEQDDFIPTHCDIEMDAVEFSDFVYYLNSNDIEISDIDGETDDGQKLFINSNNKIRPPVDVIVDRGLSLNITSGSLKMVSKEHGNTVWRDIEDYIDDFREMCQTSNLTWDKYIGSKTFVEFLNYLAQNDINVVSIKGEASNGTKVWSNSGSVPYAPEIDDRQLSVCVESGTVEKNGIYYDMKKYFNVFENEVENKNIDVEKEDSFLKSVMDLDDIPDIKDEKFFSKLRLQGKLFANMIEKIDSNNFSFYVLDAVMQTVEGEEKIRINSENVLYPSEEYVRKNANHVVVNKAAVKTNTGQMISLMEALVLLD